MNIEHLQTDGKNEIGLNNQETFLVQTLMKTKENGTGLYGLIQKNLKK